MKSDFMTVCVRCGEVINVGQDIEAYNDGWKHRRCLRSTFETLDLADRIERRREARKRRAA